MRLLLFNPSHDEALAANYPFYYPSTTARDLARRWALLPALWASRADCVLLPRGAEVSVPTDWCKDVRFVCEQELTSAFWREVTSIEPWGWDVLLRHRLRQFGAPERLLPTDAALERLRNLSSRRTTTQLLPSLLRDLRSACIRVVDARSVVADGMTSVREWLRHWHGAMVKSLWSCSGRGVLRIAEMPSANDEGRIRRWILDQGAVELEPVYRSTFNFSAELYATPSGEVRFLGFSAFAASASGAYAGNAVAPQSVLRRMIRRAGKFEETELDILAETIRRRVEWFLAGRYAGPLGVDMMFVEGNSADGGDILLHPCVEVNMRRTMGHVALAVQNVALKIEKLPDFVTDLFYFCTE